MNSDKFKLVENVIIILLLSIYIKNNPDIYQRATSPFGIFVFVIVFAIAFVSVCLFFIIDDCPNLKKMIISFLFSVISGIFASIVYHYLSMFLHWN